ncbi:MAG: hypothetical protein AAGC60_00645 [Acidobacteriota bacterium]
MASRWRTRAPATVAAVLALLVLACLVALASVRVAPSTVWADEGTFLAMAESLAHDGDLRFDSADLARLEGAEPARASLILQRTGEGVHYSKPIVYPLLAAPFVRFAGDLGPIVLNLLALVAALALALAYLRRLARRGDADPGLGGLVLVTFAGAAVVVPYALWRMADSLQFSLALAGMVLVAAQRLEGSPSRGRLEAWLAARAAPHVGVVALALLVPLRVNNAVLLVLPLGAAALARRPRRLLALVGTAAATLGVAALLSVALTDSINPYRAPRTSFTPTTGYPAGPDAAQALERFDRFLARHHTELDDVAEPRRVAYAAGYFVIGRHTGLLAYFPAALVFLGIALAAAWRGVRQRRLGQLGAADREDGALADAVTLAALAAFGGAALFLVGWKPENYFGGDTFLGNRYLLPAYPALLVALPRLPRPRVLAAAWALAVLAYGSALVSSARVDALGAAPTSQAHAYAGLYRWLPFESTAQPIAGTRDRYWAGQFVRFTDPYAKVDRGSFELVAGRPAAELSIAHWQEVETIRLLAVPQLPPGHGARLVVRDWRRTQTIELPTDGPTTLDLGLSPPWRYHRFWFEDRPFHVRALRLALEVDGLEDSIEGSEHDASRPRVRLVYLGAPGTAVGAIAHDLQSIDLPPSPVAGTTSSVRLRVKNASARVWDPDDSTPVTARWRLARLSPEGAGSVAGEWVADGDRIDLTTRVGYGEEVEIVLAVTWPAESGRYRLEVDLVLEHVAWFGDVLGAPLWSGEVTVEPSG